MPRFQQTQSADRGSMPDFIDLTETQNEPDPENPDAAEGWSGRGHVGPVTPKRSSVRSRATRDSGPFMPSGLIRCGHSAHRPRSRKRQKRLTKVTRRTQAEIAPRARPDCGAHGNAEAEDHGPHRTPQPAAPVVSLHQEGWLTRRCARRAGICMLKITGIRERHDRVRPRQGPRSQL